MNILDPIFYRTLFYYFHPVISPRHSISTIYGTCHMWEIQHALQYVFHFDFLNFEMGALLHSVCIGYIAKIIS